MNGESEFMGLNAITLDGMMLQPPAWPCWFNWHPWTVSPAIGWPLLSSARPLAKKFGGYVVAFRTEPYSACDSHLVRPGTPCFVVTRMTPFDPAVP